jgi:hypothetical protein
VSVQAERRCANTGRKEDEGKGGKAKERAALNVGVPVFPFPVAIARFRIFNNLSVIVGKHDGARFFCPVVGVVLQVRTFAERENPRATADVRPEAVGIGHGDVSVEYSVVFSHERAIFAVEGKMGRERARRRSSLLLDGAGKDEEDALYTVDVQRSVVIVLRSLLSLINPMNLDFLPFLRHDISRLDIPIDSLVIQLQRFVIDREPDVETASRDLLGRGKGPARR